MKLKQSFNELKKPIVWMHYAIGTILIVFAFKYLMDSGIITEGSPIYLYLISFYAIYIAADRTVHGVLEL